MEIINLTPHTLNIYDAPYAMVKSPKLHASIPPSGEVARMEIERQKNGHMAADGNEGSFPVYVSKVKKATKLPRRKKGTIYVVSGLYRSHNPRSDVYQPGELLRDDQGRVIGCIGLSQ